MTIPEWPENERPREKLIKQGSQQLSDAELLAILFRNGIKGKSAVSLSRDLLLAFNGLRGIFSATIQDFCTIKGLGVSKYCQCQAVLELNRRHMEEPLKRPYEIICSEQIKIYLRAKLRDHRQEVFVCLFLDNRHRLIAFEKLFHGTINSSSIHPRVIIERALHHNAAGLILAHNHPSGVAHPSQADKEMTHTLLHALQLMDIRLLDHMIVGDQTVTSLAEQGFLAPSSSI